MDEKTIRDELRGWILERSGATPDRLERDDQPILDEGLLTSLDVVEFILFIESVREEEVDIEAIEPEVRFLENVDRVDSMAYSGRAEVTVRFDENVNMSKALTDVQAAMARITTFPPDIERPVVTQIAEADDVCRIEVSGPFSEQALKLIAKRIRDDLLDLGQFHPKSQPTAPRCVQNLRQIARQARG